MQGFEEEKATCEKVDSSNTVCSRVQAIFTWDIEKHNYDFKSGLRSVHWLATVEAIKGQFGFLSYEAEEGRKLFFHTSEVKSGNHLQVGDRVEFVVVYNQRTKKYAACSVVKVGESQPTQRPERLVSRLRTLSTEDSGPRIIIVRQPRGPDGTNGFASRGGEANSSATLLEETEDATEYEEGRGRRKFSRRSRSQARRNGSH
ncbi:hypothetical protein HPB51_012425 [Rhipicephalus microplus]|uniref:CSD domain-containing protein n=1 Tax=Rhipicephalus microplus TaxID=6941 RepID=A0A9J6EA54_RHIMP|nr:hypothetical protein HPB51_012425 [Rhipicephalus microplus]